MTENTHDHDAQLSHLIDEWGALGVVMKVLKPLTDEQALQLLSVAKHRLADVPVGNDTPTPGCRPHCGGDNDPHPNCTVHSPVPVGDDTTAPTVPYWTEDDGVPLLAIPGDSYRFVEMPDIAAAALLDLVRRAGAAPDLTALRDALTAYDRLHDAFMNAEDIDEQMAVRLTAPLPPARDDVIEAARAAVAALVREDTTDAR